MTTGTFPPPLPPPALLRYNIVSMGRRQVVSHRVLAPALTGSNPVVPKLIYFMSIELVTKLF